MGNNSLDMGINALGRFYIKHTYSNESGGYEYTKLSINMPETVAAIAVAVYAPYMLPEMAMIGGTIIVM